MPASSTAFNDNASECSSWSRLLQKVIFGVHRALWPASVCAKSFRKWRAFGFTHGLFSCGPMQGWGCIYISVHQFSCCTLASKSQPVCSIEPARPRFASHNFARSPPAPKIDCTFCFNQPAHKPSVRLSMWLLEWPQRQARHPDRYTHRAPPAPARSSPPPQPSGCCASPPPPRTAPRPLQCHCQRDVFVLVEMGWQVHALSSA